MSINTQNTKCAPHKTFEKNSCFTLDNLRKIATSYNQYHSDKINTDQSKDKLVEDLEHKLSNDCSTQVCWLRLKFVKKLKDIDINSTFKPFGPKKYKWLNTLHINNVLFQYQFKYPEFLFLGTVPYDFEDLPELGLTNIDFKSYRKHNKHKLGLVINLDEHYKSGSHWVALYFDIKKNQIYFFDSVGKPPGHRIKHFIKKIILCMLAHNHKMYLSMKELNKYIRNTKGNAIINQLITFKYNLIQHQTKNSECGVYSIHFIVKLLEGVSFDDITSNIIRDEDMANNRDEFFIIE